MTISMIELDRLRGLTEKEREKAIREQPIEPNTYKPLAYFEIGRYTTGSFRGMFVVSQMLTEDKGKVLKKPIRKVVCDGVDMVVAMASLETALRRRVFN